MAETYDDYYAARGETLSSGSLEKEFLTRGRDYLQLAVRQIHSKKRAAWNESERDFWCQVDRDTLAEMKAREIPTFEDPFVLPVMHTYISSAAAAQFQMYLDRDPRIELAPRIHGQEELVEKVELLLNMNYQRARMDWFNWCRIIHSMVYGYSPRRIVWDEAAQMNRVYMWDPFLFFWDPSRPITSLHEGRFVAFQSTTDRMAMQTRGTYFNLQKLKKPDSNWLKAFGYGIERDAYSTSRNTLFGVVDPDRDYEARSTTRKIDPDTVILHEIYWKMIPAEIPAIAEKRMWLPGMDPEQPAIAIMGIGNGNTICRFDYADFPFSKQGENKQYPSGAITTFSDGLIVVPPGGAELNRGPHRFVNWLASSRKDAVQKTLNPRGIFDPEYLDLEDLNNPFPGQHIPLRPEHYGEIGNAYMPLAEHDTTQSHLNDISFMMQFMERDMASMESVQGAAPQREQKATIFSIVSRAAQGRHAVYVRLYDEQDNADLISQMIGNFREFMERPHWVRMTAQVSARRKSDPDTPTHIQIFPGDLKNVEADYVPFSPREMAFREKRAEILVEWLKLIMQMPPPVQQRFDLFEVALDIPRYAGERNIDKYVASRDKSESQPTPAQPMMPAPAPGPGPLSQGQFPVGTPPVAGPALMEQGLAPQPPVPMNGGPPPVMAGMG